MDQADLIPIFRFRTTDFHERDRFHIWVKDNLCDCRIEDDGYGPFDAEATGAALGPLIISGRVWPRRPKPITYLVNRNARRIRLDGQDSFRFTLVLGGRFLCRSSSPQSIATPGDLIVHDVAKVNDCMVEAGEVISLVVPRHLLPAHTTDFHLHTLTDSVGRMFADHLLSMFRNLSCLRKHHTPHVVQATLQLLKAALSPTAESMHEASDVVHHALLERCQRYIHAHLLDCDLSPDRICRAIGISRARLYQLFENDGGVMRQIKRMRLRRAYHVLADPTRSRIRMAELAWAHGFSDVKYFHRSFKAEFGHSPMETESHMSRPMFLPHGDISIWQEDSMPTQGWTLPFGVLHT